MLRLADPVAAYKRVDFEAYVLGCRGSELVKLCFDDIETALARSVWAFRNQRPDIQRKSLERAQMGLMVLIGGLDREHGLSGPLETLYRSMMHRVSASLSRYDPSAIEDVRTDMRDVGQSIFGRA